MICFIDIFKKFKAMVIRDRNVNSTEDLEKAKKIFFSFNGSYFFMWHEMVLDEYEKYHVSKELEKQWRDELIDELMCKVYNSVDNGNITDNIIRYSGVARDVLSEAVINKLIEYVKTHFVKLDSFTIIITLESIVKLLVLIDDRDKNKEYYIGETRHMIELMEKNVERGVTVADERYNEDGGLPRHVMPEEQLKRMREDIEKWQAMLQ